MRSLSKFIVHLPNRFKNTIKVGDKEIYLENKFNEFEHRIMEAEIVAVPEKSNTGASVGDTLYFHHHVVLGDGQYLDKANDLYIVHYNEAEPLLSQSYAYKRKSDGEVILLQDWVFLKPVEQERYIKSSVLYLDHINDEHNKEGEVAFDSEALAELGLYKGDRVYFMKNADYEMEIDGEKYWRMNTSFLTYAKVHND
jgi:co-chaperonin GroES (HSP10)